MVRYDDFKYASENIAKDMWWQGKVRFAELMGKKVYKIMNKPCQIIESWIAPCFEEDIDWKVTELRKLEPCTQWLKYPKKFWDFI